MLAVRLKRRLAVKFALAAQLLCVGYLQFIEWVPVFPWNDLSHGNGQETLDLALAVVQLAILLGFWFCNRIAMGLGLAAYAVWMYLQLDSWWRPYLFGGRTVGPHWYFARTYKFLPTIDSRPTPDAAHVVLQLILCLVLITGVAALHRALSRHPAG
jgi:quinol-cytochrome oxidoreductase complex cytochrome b subunit